MASEPLFARCVIYDVRWDRIERQPGRYDWSTLIAALRSAHTAGIQPIWNLLHTHWPADLHPFGADCTPRFAAFANACAARIAQETQFPPLFAPVREPSYLAWALGDAGPYGGGRGLELKTQLVGAALAATSAIRQAAQHARIVHIDPLIHVVAAPDRPWEQHAADGHVQAQFEAWDMLCGRAWPQLGGTPDAVDLLGVQYGPANQGVHGGEPLDRFDPRYRLLHHLLRDAYTRYNRPLLFIEHGPQQPDRAAWLQYVSRELRAADRSGIPIAGVSLLPGQHHMPLLAQPPVGDAPLSPLVPRTATAETPNVCLYTDSQDPSGMGEVMLTLAAQLHNAVKLSLVCPPHAAGARLLERAADLGITTHALALDGPHAATAPLRQFLQAQNVQIFHAHAGIGWEGLHATYVAHTSGVPAIIRTEHLPYLLTDPQQRADHAQLTEILDQLICVGNAAYRTFCDAGVPASRLRVIRNGIVPCTTPRNRLAIRAQLGYPADVPLLLTVGRITEQKGYDVLLAAVPAILAQHPNAQFLWAGEGPLLAELQAAATAAGVAHAVQFLGRRADVADLLAAADAFVLPSRFEGLPLAALEAMAAGLPVIGTQVCGTAEAVVDGVTGWLVPAEDPASLAAAVRALLTRPDCGRAWGAAGRTRVLREFNATRMANETIALYYELLNVATTRIAAPRRARVTQRARVMPGDQVTP